MTIITKNLIKKIRRIEIQTNRLAEDLLAGMYLSAFKGKGMEFEEVREYQPGDEVRSIDWNVTARMNQPYIKNFREERELTVLLLVDVSASCRYGSGEQLKSDLIAEIGGLLAFSAIKNNDKVGLVLFSDVVEKYIPPKKGLRHVLRVIRELLLWRSERIRTNLESVLTFLGHIQKKTAICFLISDFVFPLEKRNLALASKHYDLISLAVTDPTEEEFPDMGLVEMTDMETGKSLIVDTGRSENRSALFESTEQRIEECRKMMKRVGAGFVHVKTNEPYIKPLLKFFRNREGVHR